MPVKRRGSVTGESFFAAIGRPTFGEAVTGRHGYLTLAAARANVELPPLDDLAPDAAVPAHLNADRWLAGCPDCRRDYQMVWMSGPLVYMCAACWNASVGGRWRAVEVPGARAEIELAAARTADRRERNWLPGWAPVRMVLEARNSRRVPMEEYREPLEPGRTPGPVPASPGRRL